MARDRKKLKAGVWQGAGPEPGYQWSVAILDMAFDEAIRVLGEAGYHHFAMQVKDLAMQSDPTHSDMVDVRAIEAFHEIRDHGGVHGNINVRVFYGIDEHRRSIVVLGTIKKSNSGPTPMGAKIAIRRRWRLYLQGEFGFLA